MLHTICLIILGIIFLGFLYMLFDSTSELVKESIKEWREDIILSRYIFVLYMILFVCLLTLLIASPFIFIWNAIKLALKRDEIGLIIADISILGFIGYTIKSYTQQFGNNLLPQTFEELILDVICLILVILICKRIHSRRLYNTNLTEQNEK